MRRLFSLRHLPLAEMGVGSFSRVLRQTSHPTIRTAWKISMCATCRRGSRAWSASTRQELRAALTFQPFHLSRQMETQLVSVAEPMTWLQTKRTTQLQTYSCAG